MKKREKKKPGFWAEFKAFITKGNVLDLAIAVVLGAAFTAIVNGFVNGIVNPLISLAVGKSSVEEWVIVLRPEVLNAAGEVIQKATLLQYGAFLQAIINFLIIGLCLFVGMKVVIGLQRRAKRFGELAKNKIEELVDRNDEKPQTDAQTDAKSDEPAAETPAEPVAAIESVAVATDSKTDALLAEIRDLLKAQRAQSVPSAEKE